MADQYPVLLQEFTFNNFKLTGYLTNWSGNTPRRHVSQQFIKRAGARVEDMERGPRSLEVTLQFIGDTCAKDYQKFEKAVHDAPAGLLIHPTAGRWYAFCEGPKYRVDLGTAIDKIEVSVAFAESELDAQVPKDAPDVATAAQDATAQQSVFQQGVASFMALVAKANTFQEQALNALDETLSTLSTVTAPIDAMRNSITGAVGAGSSIIGAVLGVATKGELLAQDITGYIEQATDLYNGGDSPTGSSTSTDTLLGVVEASAADLVDAMIAASTTAAGAGESVGQVEEAVASCIVLAAALAAARPPVILFRVTELTNLLTLCQRRYKTNAQARASEIMGMNRLSNPIAIPAGTILRIPSR